jgi:ParB family chromosome partitioning protein
MNTQSTIQYVPLNRLLTSRLNVRRTDRKADIQALSVSIASLGLLQNLTVTPAENDKFEVVAGARRLAALKSLAKTGSIARDFAIPCQVIDSAGAGEVSLVENYHRVALGAMDEVDAFTVLLEAGSSIDDVARRFGCTQRHVEQRLALARLSPKLKNAYRRSELSLDAARAFCLVDDHAKQEAVFKALGKPVTHAGNVRAHLMQGRMRANDRLALYIGLPAYEAAGGFVTRDLFADNEAYVDDPALMTRLAHERLDGVRSELLGKGWGWVNVNLGHSRFEGGSAERLQPARRPMTEEERKKLDEINAALEALDEEMENSKEDDPRWGQRDDLAARQYAVIEATMEWDPELMALAGVVISIDHDGNATFASGIIAKADAGKVRRIRKEREAKAALELNADAPFENGDGRSREDAAETDGDCEPAPWEEPISTLPKALTRELSQARTRAIRWKLSENPDLALGLAVFALARQGLAGYPAAGIGLSLRAAPMTDHETLEEARVALGDIVPGDSETALEWLLSQPRQTLMEILAVLVAGAIDLSHEGVTRDDGRKQSMADRLAAALDLDMTRHWKPDMEFWSRLPKAALIDALIGAPSLAQLSEAERAAFQKMQAKRTKAEIAKSVEQALDGARWLPDLLVTPIPAGALSVTAYASGQGRV